MFCSILSGFSLWTLSSGSVCIDWVVHGQQLFMAPCIEQEIDTYVRAFEVTNFQLVYKYVCVCVCWCVRVLYHNNRGGNVYQSV